MVQIGRKIYYELSTGNIIVEIVDREGDVIETTQEQDYAMFLALQPYEPSAVGLLQLPFGQDKDNFSKYPHHVDPSKKTIVWDTTNPIEASIDDIKNNKIAQLNDFYHQALKSGFNVVVGGVNYTCSCTADDLARLNATNTAITKGFETFPINYAAIDGTPIPLNSQADLDAIEEAATRFGFAQHKQILDLVGQVKVATTNANGEVDNIQWTTAAY